jgi:hypothetical protein
MDDKRKKTIISVGGEDKKHVVAGSDVSIKVQGQSIDKDATQRVDLVFVIDTTGSMSDKIEGLLATCSKFVDEFAALKLDYRIAIVAFGDLTVPGDKIVSTEFSGKIETIKKSLRNIPRFGGGGNEGESSLEALDQVMGLPFRENAVKVIVLITDEPALQRRRRASDTISALSKQEFLAFVVSPNIGYFRDMATKNGGKWYQVSAAANFLDLLDMFRQMAKKVSQVVSDVHRLGGGSVANYLRLNPPDK